MYKLFYLSLALTLLTLSCNTSKKATETMDKTVQEENSDVYRFGISFYSIGAGIDVEAKKSYLKFLREFEEKNKVTIHYEIAPWGREGETDFCFKLNELDAKGQVKFIQESKENLKGVEHVHFTENEVCKPH